MAVANRWAVAQMCGNPSARATGTRPARGRRQTLEGLNYVFFERERSPTATRRRSIFPPPRPELAYVGRHPQAQLHDAYIAPLRQGLRARPHDFVLCSMDACRQDFKTIGGRRHHDDGQHRDQASAGHGAETIADKLGLMVGSRARWAVTTFNFATTQADTRIWSPGR